MTKLSKPATSEADRLTGLLRSPQMQAEKIKLTKIAAHFNNPGQAIAAFQLATGSKASLPGEAQDPQVKEFVEAFHTLESGFRQQHADLAARIIAGQVVADCVSQHQDASTLARGCTDALSSYCASSRPTMEQYRAFPTVLNEVFDQCTR